MKKTKIAYWIVTILFAAFMAFSGVQNMINGPEAKQLMETMLGFPPYFGPFVGLAKLLGAIAILIPGFPRIKEWAYAGLVFDLLGATYAIGVKMGFANTLMMWIIIVVAFTSYALYRKTHKAELA